LTNSELCSKLSENVFRLFEIRIFVASKITIHDVAQHAGVSVSSVSRALNNYPHVSEELKNRVNSAAKELGYQPAFLAHSLRRGTTNSIGFLVGTTANPVISTIFESAAEALAANDYAMTLASSGNKADLDNAYLRLLASRQVSGLIVSSAAESQDHSSSIITELGIPTVMLDRARPFSNHIYAVQSDHISGVKEAVGHLIKNGHRNIAFIGGPENFYPTEQRFLGYQQALTESGIPIKRELVRFTAFTETDAFAEALVLFRHNPLPTALIVAGNIILIGALMAVHDRGLTIGQDLALVACDDIHLTKLFQPPITAITRDLKLLGKTAARLLLQSIQDSEGKTEHIIRLPTSLIIRESSDYLV
jgi:LacI family transcriptional regulator